MTAGTYSVGLHPESAVFRVTGVVSLPIRPMHPILNLCLSFSRLHRLHIPQLVFPYDLCKVLFVDRLQQH